MVQNIGVTILWDHNWSGTDGRGGKRKLEGWSLGISVGVEEVDDSGEFVDGIGHDEGSLSLGSGRGGRGVVLNEIVIRSLREGLLHFLEGGQIAGRISILSGGPDVCNEGLLVPGSSVPVGVPELFVVNVKPVDAQFRG